MMTIENKITSVERPLVVLAPDSICFEDRRQNIQGAEPDTEDVEQHYNEMCYRLLRGDTLMCKVLSDSAQAISLLCQHPLVDKNRVGILGHSYGGNTVLFHAALDERICFACSSGVACSYGGNYFLESYSVEKFCSKNAARILGLSMGY